MPEAWPEAGPRLPAPPPAPPPETRWYGWQTLTADVLAVTLTMVLATRVDQHNGTAVIGSVVLGASAFVLGGPLVHAFHGHRTKAVGSLALRLGVPLAGMAIAAGLAGPCGQYEYDHEGCRIGSVAAGSIMGVAIAMIVDAAALGREQVTAPPPNRPSVGFIPMQGGGGLSFGGRF